ncbi:hypothetical protein GH742_11595 [Legionella sp. MW5194]|uniref:hypothetical protein n=1 Tax=Legionella sp. MW5194 TaxID=2662448 RepID=UPI00193CB79C|nr:hypothetical protein [Legionella sp. MW5194]QRN04468.1 hypothetical protein GH742_11595 [Legionella sp. MW5194]
MVKPVAFLDVDHTLIFPDPNSDDGGAIYNDTLIEALVKKALKTSTCSPTWSLGTLPFGSEGN